MDRRISEIEPIEFLSTLQRLLVFSLYHGITRIFEKGPFESIKEIQMISPRENGVKRVIGACPSITTFRSGSVSQSHKLNAFMFGILVKFFQ